MWFLDCIWLWFHATKLQFCAFEVGVIGFRCLWNFVSSCRSLTAGLRYLFCDSGRQGTQQAFVNTFKACDGAPYPKSLFHMTFSEESVRDHRKAPQSCLPDAMTCQKPSVTFSVSDVESTLCQARSVTGASLDRGVSCQKNRTLVVACVSHWKVVHCFWFEVFTLPQLETMVVMAGDAQRLTEIVGSRRNLHHSGSTAGTSLQECMKNTLKGIPVLPTAEKHKLLGNARCKDDSRSTCDAKGLDLSFYLVIVQLSMTLMIQNSQWHYWWWHWLATTPSVSGLDQPGLEPIDWGVWDPQLFAEVVVHRFKPKLVVLATASCASVLPPLLEARVPCVAVCHWAQWMNQYEGSRQWQLNLVWRFVAQVRIWFVLRSEATLQSMRNGISSKPVSRCFAWWEIPKARTTIRTSRRHSKMLRAKKMIRRPKMETRGKAAVAALGRKSAKARAGPLRKAKERARVVETKGHEMLKTTMTLETKMKMALAWKDLKMPRTQPACITYFHLALKSDMWRNFVCTFSALVFFEYQLQFASGQWRPCGRWPWRRRWCRWGRGRFDLKGTWLDRSFGRQEGSNKLLQSPATCWQHAMQFEDPAQPGFWWKQLHSAPSSVWHI